MKPTYEQLEQQLAAVVAENAGLKVAIGAVNGTAEECEVNGDEFKYVVEPSEFEALIDLLDETPATDAAIANIQAQGVEMFASHLRTNDNGASACKMIALGADEFAAQLRQGAEHE